MTKKKITEARLQYEIVQWSQDNNYYCFHCPNGEKRDLLTGNKLMAMGVKKGVPDLIYIMDNGRVVWVELKTTKGKLSKPQVNFKNILLQKNQNYVLVQADSLQEAVDYLAPELSRISHLPLL